MRLLLVTDAVGGVWVYSLELARALERSDFETVLAVMGPSPKAEQLEQAREFKLIDTGMPLDWLAVGPGDLRRTSEAIADLASREGADVVQTCSAALLADADFTQPTVAVQHSCVASWWAAVKGTALPPEFRWRRDRVKRGLKRASIVVAPSAAFATETSRIYDLAAPVTVVHNGRRAAVQTTLPPGDFVVTAGRLWDEGKNVAALDAAAGSLSVPFEAAGPVRGPNGGYATLRNLQSLGELSETRLARLFAARPVFASAALYEPFGLTALEAAHAGCALVLSDIPTHRELWDGAARFVPARDSSAFAAAIQGFLSAPDERHQLGQLARDRAQHFTPERMASGMADIYAHVGRPGIPADRIELAGAA